MKLGISTNAFGRYGDNKYNKMKEFGFDYVDVPFDGALGELTEEEYIECALREKALANAAGITVHQVHGPWIYPPQDSTPESRRLRADDMRRSIRATAAIGCKNWVIHPVMPYGTKEEPDSEEFWRINLEFFRDLLPYAKELGITICFENMPFSIMRISPPSETLRFIREINDENFKMCLDTGHSIIMNTQPADAVRMAGDDLRVLHVHDNCKRGDEHLFPFFGDIEWREFYKALKETGFDGVFSLEVALTSRLSDSAADVMLSTLPVLISEIMREDY